jgi:uncharacterized protein YrzB (UPF0473 family)
MNYDSDSIVTLIDEDGVEKDFGFVDSIQLKGNTYIALTELEDDSDDEESELILLKVEKDSNGEDTLVSIDDDDEFDDVADAFEDLFAQDIEEQ